MYSNYFPYRFFTIVFLFILMGLASCKKVSTYPGGYTATESGVIYKLMAFGDADKKPQINDFLDVHIAYRTKKDSLFLEAGYDNGIKRLIIPFNKPSFKGSFEEHFLNMNEGDSVSFWVNADSLFSKFLASPLPVFLTINDTVKLDIKIKKILNETAYQQAVYEYQQLLENLEAEEKTARDGFLLANNIDAAPIDQELYYLPLKEGGGLPVETGKTICINYKGCFLGGKVFDSNSGSMPFEFIMGDEKQVIRGLEIGLSCMREGGKAKFIIPSKLAFGAEGSSTHIVPPYSTVVYEVELLKVK